MSIAIGYGPNWSTDESRGLDAQRRIAELEQQLAAAQAEARELRAEIESEEKRFNAQQDLLYRVINERDVLQFKLARMREIVSALSQAAEQHDPLAVSDHCGGCSEPEPECVCGEQPPEHESLPLMARREWMFKAAKYAYRDRDSVWFQSAYKPGQVWEFCYRIADTDEHGLSVIERTAGMPMRAKYRISYITHAGGVYYTDILPLALEASRNGAVSERIEDYRESKQEGKE